MRFSILPGCLLFVAVAQVGCGISQSSTLDVPGSGAAEARTAFDDIKARPFGWYGTDACDGRAYLSSIALAVKGIASQNVKLVRGTESLQPPKFEGRIRWSNHVAAQVGEWVVDPALADGPVSVEEWKTLAGLNAADQKSKLFRVPGSWGFVSGTTLLRTVVQPALDRGEAISLPQTVAALPAFDFEAADQAFGSVMYQLETPEEQRDLCRQTAGLLNDLSAKGKLDFKNRYEGESPVPPAWPCKIGSEGTSVFVVDAEG